MPAPSELARSLRIGRHLPDAVTRSYLADDRVVGWYGARGVVIDAEIADQPVPATLGEHFGTEDFWARWTQAECAAKLADLPVLLWVRLHGLGAAGYRVETIRLEDLVVSVGFPPA